MPIWTVHAPPAGRASPEPGEDYVFIREGFSWTALIVPPIWTLRHRLWLATALWLVAQILIGLVSAKLAPAAGWPLWLGFTIWFALEARNFRRAKLAGRGWETIGLVDARSLKEAERRFFEKAQRLYRRSPLPPMPPAASAVTPPPLPLNPTYGRGTPAVIGYVSGDPA